MSIWSYFLGLIPLLSMCAVFLGILLAFELAHMRRTGMAPFKPVKWDGLYRVERKERRNGEAFYIVTAHAMFGDYFPADEETYQTQQAAIDAAEAYYQENVVRRIVV